jgi:integrase
VDGRQYAGRVDASLTALGRGRGDGGRLREKTRRAYAKAWAAAEAWVRSEHLTVMPWSSETLARYAAVLLEQGYAKATVDGRLSAVKAKHRERGEPVPDGVAAWYVLRGADDTAADPVMVNNPRPRRAALAAIAAELDPATAAGARDLAMVTLGWDLLARTVDLVALDIGDVLDAADGDGLVVRLGDRWLPVDHVHDPVDVCPVEPTLAWLGHLRQAGAMSGPLFRAVDKGGNIAGCGPHASPPSSTGHRLADRSVRHIWTRLVVKGRWPRSATMRDLRTAAAVEAARNGVPVLDILARGGWSRGSGRVVAMLVAAAAEGPVE